jgi:hypothetical protein
VDVLAGGQVHHGIGAPERRPAQLVDFLGDRRRHGGVADVGVDLHEEVAADDHRLELEVIDVRGNDGATSGHFIPHEIGRQPLANGDEVHLGRDLAFARVGQLRHRVAAPRRRAAGRHPRFAQFGEAAVYVVILRTTAVVHAQRRLLAGQRDLTHRHPHALWAVDQDFG